MSPGSTLTGNSHSHPWRAGAPIDRPLVRLSIVHWCTHRSSPCHPLEGDCAHRSFPGSTLTCQARPRPLALLSLVRWARVPWLHSHWSGAPSSPGSTLTGPLRLSFALSPFSRRSLTTLLPSTVIFRPPSLPFTYCVMLIWKPQIGEGVLATWGLFITRGRSKGKGRGG